MLRERNIASTPYENVMPGKLIIFSILTTEWCSFSSMDPINMQISTDLIARQPVRLMDEPTCSDGTNTIHNLYRIPVPR